MEKVTRAKGIDVSLPTSSETVQTLQTSLQAKAKAEPAYRFYSLWDKVCRADVLRVAYRRCRANRGAPGYDGESFQQIEDQGVEGWLERLQQELWAGGYQPQPLLRVWIPKALSERVNASKGRRVPFPYPLHLTADGLADSLRGLFGMPVG